MELETEQEIVGATGTIRVARPFKPGVRESIVIARGDEVEERIVEAQPLYVDQIEDFARVVGGAAKPKVTLDDSRGNVTTIRALLESAATGRAVTLSV